MRLRREDGNDTRKIPTFWQPYSSLPACQSGWIGTQGFGELLLGPSFSLPKPHQPFRQASWFRHRVVAQKGNDGRDECDRRGDSIVLRIPHVRTPASLPCPPSTLRPWDCGHSMPQPKMCETFRTLSVL